MFNFDYEVEVEIGSDSDYEVEVEYDDGYHPSYEVEVDYGGGFGYHNEPEIEVEIEYEQPTWHESHHVMHPGMTVDMNYTGGHGNYGQHMGGFGQGQNFQMNANFNTTGWQQWGAPTPQLKSNWNVPWTGTYNQGGQQFQMAFQNFQIDFNGNMWGHGNDNQVGAFNISGKMRSDGKFKFNKQYVGAHCVVYQGKQQGVYLSGNWQIPGNCSGTFQIKCQTPRWTGCYWQNGQRQNMALDMHVSKWGVTGYGQDNVGSFNIRGEVHGNVVTFCKAYWGQHQVFYQGQLQNTGNGQSLKGYWQIPGNCSGKFQMHH